MFLPPAVPVLSSVHSRRLPLRSTGAPAAAALHDVASTPPVGISASSSAPPGTLSYDSVLHALPANALPYGYVVFACPSHAAPHCAPVHSTLPAAVHAAAAASHDRLFHGNTFAFE